MQFSTRKIVFFIFSIMALSACGGGGSGKSSSPEIGPGISSSSVLSSRAVSSISTSTSTSSSSASAAAKCTNSIGDVFINSVCPGWSDVSVYERFTEAPSAVREIRDGLPGDLVTQQIIDSGIAGRDQVLDIQYNSRSPELNGIVRIFSSDADGVDMSSYATGKLVFDLKLISAGDDHPYLDLVIECGWPCNTHAHHVRASQLDRWQTFEFSIKDLIAEGLDIKHVTTSLLIVPTWSRQANVHFQLDNIRWVKGASEPVTEEVCFANHLDFNDWNSGENDYFFKLQSFAGAVNFDRATWLGQFIPDIILNPQWELVPGKWGFAISEPLVKATMQPIFSPSLSQCASHGTLSAQVYLPSSYVADGKMKVGLYIVDSVGGTYSFTSASLSAAAMTPDGWTKVKVNLDTFSAIYDAAKIGVFFDPNGKSPSVTGNIRVDNFVISHSVTP